MPDGLGGIDFRSLLSGFAGPLNRDAFLVLFDLDSYRIILI